MPALEWVQCQGCGRRHRWQVELANTEIVCPCGAKVAMPDLEAFEAAQGRDPDATATGKSSSGSLITVDEPEPVQAGRLREYHGRGAGLWGMSTFSTFLFWFALSLAGFFFLAHAAILQATWSIVGAVLIAPLSFIKASIWYKRWLRGRTLAQAIDDELNRGAN